MKLPLSFMAKVSPEPNSGCWLWAGAADPTGYGNFWCPDTKAVVKAHRYASAAAGHVHFDDCEVDHICCVKLCVNPEHLEPVTRAENNRRARAAKGLMERCAQGHALTGHNAVFERNGRRKCRACRNAARRARRSNGATG